MTETLITCVVLIPQRATVEGRAPVVRFERAILFRLGGFTRTLTEAVGAWLDETGQVFEDPSDLYIVAIPHHPQAARELRALVRRLATDMGEKCMLVLLPNLSGDLIWATTAESHQLPEHTTSAMGGG